MITDRFPRLKGLVLDMDGVLWREDEAIGNLPQIFETIRKLGLSFVLATNNATRSISEYIEKFAGFGVEVEPGQVLSSAMVTVEYLKQSCPQYASLYVIGSKSLADLLRDNGYQVLTLDDRLKADAVIVALDKELSYHKLRYASQLIRNGASFIATNPDITFPTPEGLIPGAGTIVKAVEVASEKKPIIIGKPERYIFKQAIKVMGTQANETLSIGDRLDTDILGAQNAGLLNALVLSGVTSIEEAESSSYKIDLIANNLWELLHV